LHTSVERSQHGRSHTRQKGIVQTMSRFKFSPRYLYSAIIVCLLFAGCDSSPATSTPIEVATPTSTTSAASGQGVATVTTPGGPESTPTAANASLSGNLSFLVFG